MPGHDIIVIGTSAGGLEALITILQALPRDIPAAIFVVQHIAPTRSSLLPTILNRVSVLPAVHPSDGTPIQHGHIYVAPPDHHMLVRQRHIHIIRGPKENGFRPAIDATFRTAAQSYELQVVGVILTGMLDDGTAGLFAIKRHGGIAIVQDPQEALYPDMPTSACRYVKVDAVLPMGNIAPELLRLAHTPIAEEGGTPMGRYDDLEHHMSEMDLDARQQVEKSGPASPFSCPECGGVLIEFSDGNLLRFRCQIGHTFSQESYLASQGEMLDRSLDAALRSLEERAHFAHRLMQEAQTGKDTSGERRFRRLMLETEGRKEQIRLMIVENGQKAALLEELDDEASAPAAG